LLPLLRPLQANSGVDRLYVLECSHGTAPDQGRFSPGYNDRKPFDLSNNCYLIRHTQGFLLWNTGIPDKFPADTERHSERWRQAQLGRHEYLGGTT
jgi:hypothetical protein